MNTTTIAEYQVQLKSWLFEHALPLWWMTGADLQKGGFFEKINLDGTPCDVNRRTRVAARQVYTYSLAKKMGYNGEVDAAIDQGLSWLNGPASNPMNGLLYAVLTPEGLIVRGDFDVYDHAFVLLAYASAYTVRKDLDLIKKAVAIRDTILRDYSHPVRGFEESIPRTLPLKANPHMHMFEACLAWIEAGEDDLRLGNGTEGQLKTWTAIASMIADLCLEKFLHPQNGSLREFFDGDWNPMEGDMGRIIEPGHQFEWAWLLLRWAKMSGDSKYARAAHRLIEIAEGPGTDHTRNVTIFELWDDLTVKDPKARLWSQTERIKAFVRLSETAESPNQREGALSAAVAGVKGLMLYLNTKIKGLYSDRMGPDGTFETEPAPTSSLYHIICAIDEFNSIEA